MRFLSFPSCPAVFDSLQREFDSVIFIAINHVVRQPRVDSVYLTPLEYVNSPMRMQEVAAIRDVYIVSQTTAYSTENDLD